MNARSVKPRNNNYQPAAYRPVQMQTHSGTAAPSIVNSSAGLRQFTAYQEMANNMPQVKQLRAYQAMADRYTSSVANSVIQRMIGEGGKSLYGDNVVDTAGNLYKITSHKQTKKLLEYRLKDDKGNYTWVDAKDDEYDIYEEEEQPKQPDRSAKKRTRSAGRKEPPKKKQKTAIKFTVARRDEGARTRTTFENSEEAVDVLVAEGLSKKLAKSLVAKDDWSYPTMRSLMETLQTKGILQPGVAEGAKLWSQHQQVGKYTVQTTDTGSQLAQIVGCHMMEYQETNNGTQGPIQQKDFSRKKQLEFSQEVLKLAPDQVARHSLGIGLPVHANLFPALFDVKLEDKVNKVFSKTAGSLTFKLYQSALKKRRKKYDHTNTLDPDARRDRKKKIRLVLKEKAFEVDKLDRFKDEEESFLKKYVGIKDTDSEDSFDEAEDWESPYTLEKVGQWTLREFYEHVYKQNVYSGVLLKDTASKLAELDVYSASNPNPGKKTTSKISRARRRRTRVQSRVQQVNESLKSTMRALGIDIVKVYSRVRQWKVKNKALTSINTDDVDKKARIAELQNSLNEFAAMKLTDMKVKGYPPPLDGIGTKKFEDLGAAKAAPKKRKAGKKVVVKQ